MQNENAPLIRAFRILGLHGYKDMEVEFTGAARIVLAENGTGKTTFLNALSNFLQASFSRLHSMQFDSIECELRGTSKPLVIRREQLPQKLEGSHEATLNEFATYAGVGVGELERLIAEGATQQADLFEDPIVRNIYLKSPYSHEDIASQIAEMRSHIERTRTDDLKELAAEIQSATSEFEILYLPTYRRVEHPLGKKEADRNRRAFLAKRAGQFRRLRRGTIGTQYGLTDVEDRLAAIQHEVQSQSNVGYRVISANIIDDLLAARMTTNASETELPDIKALALFFSRIEKPTAAEERLKSIRKLYETEEIFDTAHEPLRFFLGKLSKVVEKTRELETSVEQFVERANVYLEQSSDEKNLHFDPTRMHVVVRNQWTQERIKMDDLSSGEKQVISLLAHMYLYDKRKIVLIDEPELSLSIDWQRRLLPDVLNSPNCEQLLAITHSPFIFDNELDPFAGPITITKHRTKG